MSAQKKPFRPINLFFLFLSCILISGLAQAQNSAGSAFGESVDLSIKTAFSLVTVEAESGPLPLVSGSTLPPFNITDSLLGVDVNANLKLSVLPLPLASVGILETGLLEVETSGNGSPQSDSSASVANVDFELVGTTLNLLPLLLGIQADEVVSTASAAGSCDSGLTASGTTRLTNASVLGDVLALAGIDAALAVNPPANFVLLDLDILGGHLRVVLNEQIVTGDGTSSRGITVNAIHITLDQIPIAALITDVTGDVIISQSKASVSCATADLSIAKVDSSDPVIVGEPMFYTLTIHNAGPDTANNVMVVDHWPAASATVGVIDPSQGSCAIEANVITCELGDIASDGSATITINGTPTLVGPMSNTATVTSDAADPSPGDNQATEETEIDPAPGLSADLEITISDSPDPVTVGETLTVTLDVLNNGGDAAESVVVVYDIPPGYIIDSVTPSQGNDCNVTATQVTCNLGTLADAGTADVVIEMTPPLPGLVTHHATVGSNTFDDNLANNQASEDGLVEVADDDARANINIVKQGLPNPVIVGQPLSYTLTVTNTGPDAANTVVLTDELPAGLTFVSASATPTGACDHEAGTVICNLGALADEAIATVTLVVIPTVSGPVFNTASVVSDVIDPDLTDNTDTAENEVGAGAADLSMTKTALVETAVVGDAFTYLLTVVNNGPDAATLVEVVDQLPASLIFGSAIPSQGSCDGLANPVTCQLGTIAAMGSATVVIEVTPTEPGMLTNTAVVDSQLDDPIPDNNEEIEETDVDPRRANLALSKSASMNPAFVDVPFEYTLAVLNAGPQEATLVTLEDQIPASLTIGTLTVIPADQGVCGTAGQLVTCDLGTIENGASVQVVIEVTPTELGPLNNTAVVDSETEDPDPSDNTATNSTEVITGRATFAVSKIFSDGNLNQVEVSIDCNTGLILDQSKLISQNQGVVFVVTDYDSGDLNCTITEAVPAGYAPSYDDGTSSNAESCQFAAVESNQDFSCVITNTVQPVTITIEKAWEFEGTTNAINMGYELVVSCNAAITGGGYNCGMDVPTGSGGYDCIRLYSEGNGFFNVEVTPEYPSSSCTVTEYPYDDAVEISNGCEKLIITAGQDNSCLITNTVFFEGIPVLDQRSMFLLALLLLGLGVVAVRRVGG